MDPALTKVHGVDGAGHFAEALVWVDDSDLAEDAKLFRAVVTMQDSSKTSMSVFFAALIRETIDTRGSKYQLRLAIAKILALRGQRIGDYMPRVVSCFYALGAHLFAKHLDATTLHDSLADRGSVGQGQRSAAVNVHYTKMLAVLTSTKPAAQASLAVMTSGIRVALCKLDGEAEGVSEETDDDLEDGL